MRFLKVLFNSFLSGLFFSTLIALLIYNININLSFNLLFFFQIILFCTLTYGLLITLFVTIIFYIIQFFSSDKKKISFVSPVFLCISFTLLILFYFIFHNFNYNYFRSFFNPFIDSLLKQQMMFLSLIVICGLITLYSYFYFRKKTIALTTFFILFSFFLTIAILKRTEFPQPVKQKKTSSLERKELTKKVIIIGLEGVSFDFLIPLMNQGKLKNFSWLIDNGCWGKIKSFSPCEPLPLNNSFNSGKKASKHRQLSLFKYQLFHFDNEIEVVPKYMFFRQFTRIGILFKRPVPTTFYSKNIWDVLKENKIKFLKRDWPTPQNIENPNTSIKSSFDHYFNALKHESEDIFQAVKTSFFTDSIHEELFNKTRKKDSPELEYLMLNGLNKVESYFYKYSYPHLFGNLKQEDITKFGSVIELYYQFYDNIIGKYLGSMKEDELLIVYSSHGIEPLPLWKRFIELLLGNPNVSAYYDLAPEGVFFFKGDKINKGKNIEEIELIDITPTILYYLGLQVGLDMDGVARTFIFQDAFREENPVAYISSYDNYLIK